MLQSYELMWRAIVNRLPLAEEVDCSGWFPNNIRLSDEDLAGIFSRLNGESIPVTEEDVVAVLIEWEQSMRDSHIHGCSCEECTGEEPLDHARIKAEAGKIFELVV